MRSPRQVHRILDLFEKSYLEQDRGMLEEILSDSGYLMVGPERGEPGNANILGKESRSRTPTTSAHGKTENGGWCLPLFCSQTNKRSVLGRRVCRLMAALDEYEKDDNLAAFLKAICTVVEAQGGIGALSEKINVNRQHLYRSLSEKGNPTIRTLHAILNGLGLKLTIRKAQSLMSVEIMVKFITFHLSHNSRYRCRNGLKAA